MADNILLLPPVHVQGMSTFCAPQSWYQTFSLSRKFSGSFIQGRKVIILNRNSSFRPSRKGLKGWNHYHSNNPYTSASPCCRRASARSTTWSTRRWRRPGRSGRRPTRCPRSACPRQRSPTKLLTVSRSLPGMGQYSDHKYRDIQ